MVIVPRCCLSCRGASQEYALQSDEIIGILKVLFRYVGIGTRLALCCENWLALWESVVLVPDPIVYEPVENIGKTGLLCEPHVSCKTVTQTAVQPRIVNGWLHPRR